MEELNMVSFRKDFEKLCLESELDPVPLADGTYANAEDEWRLWLEAMNCESVYNLVTAMRKFCDRVDRGEIRSKKTYLEFKLALIPWESK